MKLLVPKAVLENMLIHLQPYLEKKDISQISSHIFIKAANGFLTLKATDYEIGLKIDTNQSTIEEAGHSTANGKKFLDIIRILKEGDVLLHSNEDTLYIEQNSSKFKLPMMNSDEFPIFPSREGKPTIELDGTNLIQSLKKITPSIDNNNPKFELNGALIDIKHDSINFVSTDTRRLAIVSVNNSTTKQLALIIPKKAIIEIQKLFSQQLEIHYDETYLIIQSDHYLFFTKLTNGKFPDYDRIIPKNITHTLNLPKSIMIDSIRQISTISTEMKITFHNETILFESLSDDNNEAKTQTRYMTNMHEPFSIAINSRYLLDFLGQVDGDEFTIGFNEANMPFIVRNNTLQTIIMPIII